MRDRPVVMRFAVVVAFLVRLDEGLAVRENADGIVLAEDVAQHPPPMPGRRHAEREHVSHEHKGHHPALQQHKGSIRAMVETCRASHRRSGRRVVRGEVKATAVPSSVNRPFAAQKGSTGRKVVTDPKYTTDCFLLPNANTLHVSFIGTMVPFG